MARGGGRGRRTSYVRDNSGRFASTPGGGPSKRSTPATRRAARPKVTGGTLGARGSLRRSRAKLAAKDPADRSLRGSLSLRAQKGAVTKGANRLGKARAASTVRMAGKGPAGVIRKGGKGAAKPVAAAKSSVRVIRPNRPAMRPGPTADRGKISEYVGAVRGARRRLSNAKPGTANAAEAKQGLKDNRQALSRRIQRERGARRGLKPATSQQVLTSTVPAPPARRMKAARPAGTVVKPKGLKVGALASQSNPQPQRKRKVDYTGAVKLLSRQKAAINRLKNPQQTFNGNAAYARQVDVRTAKSTPAANAQREIRALYGEYRRAQSSAKSQYASQEVRTRAASELPTLRKKIRKAVQSARAFKPEYSAEARRRFQAAQARNRR